MRAALTLRLLEARRRGIPALLVVGALVVALTALFGGETPDGRYGLASDLAAALAYLAAVFIGAFPLAVDRERRRAYLPGASPVTPWGWALGNALGAALVAGALGLGFFAAAGAGSALGGGIETHAVAGHTGQTGIQWVRGAGLSIPVPGSATRMRLSVRTFLRGDDVVGALDAAMVEVDGKPYEIRGNQTIVVPITTTRVDVVDSVHAKRVIVRNLSPEYAVGLVKEEMRALGEARPFLLNAIGAGIPPAIGAAALAAFGAAAGANLSAPVAALLTALVLLLASLKGFLLETFTHEGKQREVKEHRHEHEVEHAPPPGREAAKSMVKGVLRVLPDLGGFDRTDRVAFGEWTGPAESGRAALFLLVACLVATGVGGAGVRARRMP